MLADSPAILRGVFVVVAVLGLLLLLGGMVGFEQRRRGRLALLVAGSLLVLGSVGAVVWTSSPS